MNAHPGESAVPGPRIDGRPVPGASGGLADDLDPHHGERRGAEESDSPGAALRARREALGLTIQQAAEALHLDPAMVAAIEADRFAALGAPVYARGHLRKYAIVLGLSPEWAIERYEALADPVPLPAPVAGSRWRERSASKLPLWITLALLAAGVTWGVYGLYQERYPGGQDVAARTSSEILDELTAPPPGGTPPRALPLVSEEITVASEEISTPAAARTSGDALQEPLASAVADASPPAERSGITEVRPEARPPAAPEAVGASVAPAAPAMRLRLAFSGTSWTEVYDAAGKQLVFGMGTAEKVYEAAGVPPLRVILGYASAVNVQVDGQAIVIPRRAGRNTARFIIAADGSPVEAELSDE